MASRPKGPRPILHKMMPTSSKAKGGTWLQCALWLPVTLPPGTIVDFGQMTVPPKFGFLASFMLFYESQL